MGNEKKNTRVNEDFFNEIYSEYYVNVYRKIKNTLYSKIDDDITSCVQETFAKAWIKIDALKEHKNVAGWLITTAKNISYNFNTKYLTRQKLVDDSTDMENIIQEKDFTQEVAENIKFEDYMKSNIVEKFMSELSESDRRFYELKFIKKISNEEIGKILGMTPHNVVVKSRRLIEKFKKEYLGSKK